MNCMNLKVSCNYLDESNFKCPYISLIPLELLESKMENKVIEFYNSQSIQGMQFELNNLEKRKLRNLWTDSQHSKTRHVNEVLYNT